MQVRFKEISALRLKVGIRNSAIDKFLEIIYEQIYQIYEQKLSMTGKLTKNYPWLKQWLTRNVKVSLVNAISELSRQEGLQRHLWIGRVNRGAISPLRIRISRPSTSAGLTWPRSQRLREIQ